MRHKLLFTLEFIFTLLNYITRLAKKTGYDETKTLLHITFALVNKKKLCRLDMYNSGLDPKIL